MSCSGSWKQAAQLRESAPARPQPALRWWAFVWTVSCINAGSDVAGRDDGVWRGTTAYVPTLPAADIRHEHC